MMLATALVAGSNIDLQVPPDMFCPRHCSILAGSGMERPYRRLWLRSRPCSGVSALSWADTVVGQSNAAKASIDGRVVFEIMSDDSSDNLELHFEAACANSLGFSDLARSQKPELGA